jgi:hypothetical protein
MLFGDIEVPKDVMWLILRQVIADEATDLFGLDYGGDTIARFFEEGNWINGSHASTLGLLVLTQVCWAFRSLILSKRELFPYGFLFKKGSF